MEEQLQIKQENISPSYRRNSYVEDIRETNIKEEPIDSTYNCEIKQENFHESLKIKISKQNLEQSNSIEKPQIKDYYVTNSQGQNKSYNCNICHDGFSAKNEVKNHIELVHEGKKSFECKVCNTSFLLKSSLKNHVKIYHRNDEENKTTTQIVPNEEAAPPVLILPKTKLGKGNNPKSYDCDFCGKYFSLKGNLKAHMKAIHNMDLPNTEKKYFNCEFCDESFSKLRQLKKHTKEVHEVKELPKCEQCDAEFKTNGKLNRHVREVHEREKPFTCETCGESFITEQTIKRHINAMHPDVIFPSLKEGIYCSSIGCEFSNIR